jgi:hypothetical protein
MTIKIWESLREVSITTYQEDNAWNMQQISIPFDDLPRLAFELREIAARIRRDRNDNENE